MVDALTRGLAIDLAPVRVNSVCPGMVLTEVSMPGICTLPVSKKNVNQSALGPGPEGVQRQAAGIKPALAGQAHRDR